MTRHEYTQHADPSVIRRVGARKVQLPEGVTLIRMVSGKINGEDMLLAVTTDGLYAVRELETTKFQHRPGEIIRYRPMRRSTDRDYRPLWIAVVAVLTGLALWWTL